MHALNIHCDGGNLKAEEQKPTRTHTQKRDNIKMAEATTTNNKKKIRTSILEPKICFTLKMQYVVDDNNNAVRKVILTMFQVIYTRNVHKNLFRAEENNSNSSDDNENAIGIVFVYANQLENMHIFGESILFYENIQCFCLFYFGLCFPRIKSCFG